MKIKFLDGLRGIAIFFVLCAHDGYIAAFFVNKTFVGHFGVDLFFFLSSFLITMILYKKLSKLPWDHTLIPNTAKELIIYFVKRIMRIYPVLLLALIFSVCPVISRLPCGSIEAVLGAMRWEYVACHFWTMSVELAWYLYIPPLVLIAVFFGKYWPLPVMITLPAIFYHMIVDQPEQEAQIIPNLPNFVTASCFAIIYVNLEPKKNDINLSKIQKYALEAFHLICIVLFLSAMTKNFLYALYPPMFGSRGTAYVFPWLGCIIVKELMVPGYVTSFLELYLLCFLGEISYALYVFHYVGFEIGNYLSTDQNHKSYLAWPFALLLGWLVHIGIEKPAFKLTGWICKKISDFFIFDLFAELLKNLWIYIQNLWLRCFGKISGELPLHQDKISPEQ